MQSYAKHALFIAMLGVMLLAVLGAASAAGSNDSAASDMDVPTAQTHDTATTSDIGGDATAADKTDAANEEQSSADGASISSGTAANDKKTQSIAKNPASSTTQGDSATNVSTKKTYTTSKTLKAAAQEVTVSDYGGLWDAITESTTDTLVINLETGTYAITKSIDSFGSAANITINGCSSTINGQNKYQFMNIADGIAVNLNNLTITNCTSTYGGAIDNNGTLNIANTSFTKNNATEHGGAIVNYATSNIANSTFLNNSAKAGGAIRNYGTLNIASTSLVNNSLEGYYGVYYGGYTYGGAIFNDAYLTIADSSFINNTIGGYVNDHLSGGGAIYNGASLNIINTSFLNNAALRGGAIYNKGTLSTKDTSFLNNSARLSSYSPAVSSGGAICNMGLLDIANNTFANNIAAASETHSYYYNTSGGAIYNGGILNARDASFLNNSARDGGAIYNNNISNVTSSIFMNNSAKVYGGAIANYGILNTTKTAFLSNSVLYSGGAIYNDNTAYTNNVSFAYNNAASEGGAVANYGALYINDTAFDSNKAAYGGAIENYDALTVTKASFTNNTATLSGGAIENYGTSSTGNVSFINNTAAYGGAINNDGTLNISLGTFMDNKASYGESIINWGALNISNSALINNNASADGTAIIYSGSGDAALENSVLSFNKLNSNGMLYIAGGTFALSGNTIANNTASDGYLINAKGGSLTASGNTFINNTNDNHEDILFNRDSEGSNANITSTGNVYIDNYLHVDEFDVAYDSSSDVEINAGMDLYDVYNDTVRNGTITLTINDEEYPTAFNVKDGKANIILPTSYFEKQDNSIILSYSPLDHSYQASIAILPLHIDSRTTNIIIAAPAAMTINKTYAIEVALYDQTANKPIPNQQINITVGGKTYACTTGEDGTYAFEYLANTTDKEITAAYGGTEIYLKSSASQQLNIKLIDAAITIENTPTVKINETTQINITLKDEYGRALAGQQIEATIGNFVKTLHTDGNGAATFTYNSTTAGTKEITVSYNGDGEFYAQSANTSQITISKLSTTITLEDATATYGNSFTLKATITDENGNPVNGGKVAFKLNGKTIRDAEGNVIYAYVSNGIAQITVDNVYGVKSYELSAVYSGTSDVYESARAYGSTLTVANAGLEMTITPNTYATQTDGSITATVTVRQGGMPISVGKVAVKINGLSIRDSNGNVIYGYVKDGETVMTLKIPSNLKTGTYNLTAVYGGKNYNRCEASTTIAITKARV